MLKVATLSRVRGNEGAVETIPARVTEWSVDSVGAISLVGATVDASGPSTVVVGCTSDNRISSAVTEWAPVWAEVSSRWGREEELDPLDRFFSACLNALFISVICNCLQGRCFQ